MLSEHFLSLRGERIMPRASGAVFVVFEGPDGAGKTTQAGILKTYLEAKGLKVLLTKEPTSETEAGRKVREILNSKINIDPKELQKLFIEDRREHIGKEIIPALKQGEIVICDRYFFSTFAYGYIDNPNVEELINLNRSFIMPDVTLLLLADPEKCIARLDNRSQKIDLFEKVEKLRKVNEGYRMLANRFKNVITIDGEKRIGDIHNEIIKILGTYLKIA